MALNPLGTLQNSLSVIILLLHVEAQERKGREVWVLGKVKALFQPRGWGTEPALVKPVGHRAVPQHGDAFRPRAPSAEHSALYVQYLFCQGVRDRVCTTCCLWRYQWSLSTAPHCRDAASLASVQEANPQLGVLRKKPPPQ